MHGTTALDRSERDFKLSKYSPLGGIEHSEKERGIAKKLFFLSEIIN